MSLQVWLPLLGNIKNQGVSNLSFTNSNATVSANGKLGSCYSFNASNSSIDCIHDKSMWRDHPMSYLFWFKCDQTKASGTLVEIGADLCAAYLYDTNGIRFRYWRSYKNSSGTRLGDSTTDPTYFDASVWHHVAFVFDSGINRLYIDGSLINTWDKTSLYTDNDPFILGTSYNKLTIGRSYGSTNFVGGFFNDLRVYDHAISAKEIKEISKGLVCHYQLNDPYSTNNLIPNGYGIDGALGWSSSSAISTTEIPPNQTNIKASYYNSNMTDYIPVVHGTIYTFSLYLKAIAKSGNVYPSFRVYDIDKKEIVTYKCGEGFSATYKTTLAQPLHKGDTVIYATDLSKWTTADNYYNYCAIFGYKDSQGTVYPDMGYTQDAPQFASKGSTKTNIDKTNNSITLNAPYAGEDRPIGTTICQSTAGGTYVYPMGAINVSTITDWTYKTTTINPDTNARFKYARYTKFLAYVGAYYAGIQLTDNNNIPKVYDCSGNCYDGIVNGNLVSCLDTPRLSRSTLFGDINNTIQVSNPSFLSSLTEASVCWWEYCTTTTNKLMFWGDSDKYISAGSTSNPMYDRNIGTEGISFYIDSVLQTTTYASTNNRIDHSGSHVMNEWHFMCLTGINLSGWTQFFINGYSGFPANSRISDFRIYATTLSADDVTELYEALASVSNKGEMFTQGEYVEL